MKQNTSLEVFCETLRVLQEKKCFTEDLIKLIKKEIKKLEQQKKLEDQVILSLAKEIKEKKKNSGNNDESGNLIT